MKEKLFIKNRKGQKMAVVVENEVGKELVFVMHGLGGDKEQLHMQNFSRAFLDKGFIVVTFDTTNTFGESDGNYEDATITNYYEDLEDVIFWSKKQKWYKEKFFLIGHILGGICTLLYLIKYPKDVKAIAPISTVVSGQLSLESPGSKNWKEWKEKGYKEWTGASGRQKKLPWSHYEDRLKYNILPYVKNIKIPVLMIVGEKDESTPVEHQRLLYDALETDKELHIIAGSEHTFRDEKHLKEIKEILNKWIERVIRDE